MICPACAAAIHEPTQIITEPLVWRLSVEEIKAKLTATFATMTKDGQGLSRSQVETIMGALEKT